ncbi:MFS transporter [Actinomadura opuntiae]|uniref:MFS transporter n=1 Tax=Actinomadura sp. OS1-43 TaxID=604315 RepID=UPI00255B0984|nr:MFS transporter [Actinomadura sp. OS1-43]MDL4816954.1 MFS transporter [Actinomadura sp. OS1-43]
MSGLLGRLVGLPDVPAVRRWAWVAVADSLGTGLITPLVIIYFTQQIGMKAVTVGLAMSIAGIGSAVLVPFGGVFVDRFGAKPLVITAFALAGIGTTGYMFARNFGVLVLTVLLANMADASGRPAKHSFMAQIADGEARNRLLAFNRSVRNAGYGVGGLLAAIVLGLGSHVWYVLAFGLDALSFFVAIALVVGIVPPPLRSAAAQDGEEAAPAKARGGYAEVLSDWRYTLLSALNVLVLLEATIFTVGVPLWVVQHTDAPKAVVGVLFTVNTVMIVLLQVRATKGLEGPADVRPSYQRAALGMTIAVAGYLLAQYVGAVLAVVLLVLAVVLHSVGELSASASEWTVSIGLARERLRGRYLAVFALGDSIGKAAGPVVVTFLLSRATSAGWLVLLALVAGSCLVSAELAVRHPRNRAPEGALTEMTA